ncbi:malonyl CoA-ACP transacylase [Salinisphaera orenii MK-B5]|uniref:Malonyl CoA-acyl carrier protein transacylase n=1 Tax=Salinisphaera orenii MK-B5 TaxID=856730 RepID=A0A423PL13_9GAMM|nr:ACP S-malonyltransferase [Salinisphaera orenii]ROO26222.1 malonyl CoA-ACP transacylase [Salinisphaera orenii MK-B5]
MSRFAMLFPGQGAQSVGMLAQLAEHHPVVGDTFTEASDVLGYDMAALINEGPADRLDQTEYTQPALVAAGVATWRAWRESGGATPEFLAGHSLGEYAALVAAQALDFSDALRLTRLRGQAMQSAVGPDEGAMAAIIGLEDDAVRQACAEAEAEHAADGLTAAAANFNAPLQVVIAGDAEAIATAGRIAKDKGAKMVKPLTVSVPSHCALMKPAAERLQSHLLETPLREPKLTVLHNVDAQPREDVDGIRKALVAQLAQSVLWTDTIRAMRNARCALFLECGPGRVLTGLNKRIDKTAQTLPLSDIDSFRQALDATAGEDDE